VETPELIVLFADADAERFVMRLIERGVERGCLRRFEWRALRDPMHDARVANNPTAALAPFLRTNGARYLVLWDHRGAGRDDSAPCEVEAEVSQALQRVGIGSERVAAISFTPELEVALLPVWESVLTELARHRAMLPTATPIDPNNPKESLNNALHACQLRASPALFTQLATVLSLEHLKTGDALGRVGRQLVTWFGVRATDG